jgi:hypothetical protein
MKEAPRRLIDDPEVSSSLRDDLARAGEEHHAYAASYDAASKAAGLQAALASQGSGVASMGLLAKLALGTVAAAAFMFAGAALYARLYARSDATGLAATTVAAAAPASVVPAGTPQVEHTPQVITQKASGAPVVAPMRAPTSLAPRAHHSDTQQEIRQLVRIRAYMQSGDAASALQLAERGQRELGDSALWQEREALAVLALFELGRTEQAKQRSGVLLARFPNSPFRAELERRLRRAHEQ